ncbi:esterase-like activity of phytase family protein [Hymenobacter sp. IS2118]|uniref:esterase-like activity of phytase family protein n=1 Tax=Hymenobacter sp. IS2118 TaxID=1505605 RepID=UPI00055820DF|nr:esterase-like activity of phytase family protein [Hymenobacter sp. IS2118]
MKCLTLFFLSLFSTTVWAQNPQFIVRELSLPAELKFYDNQFSGLCLSGASLLLLSESRLQDKAPAKLYQIATADLDRKLADTAYVLPFKKLPIYNLDIVRVKMKAAGQSYEGLEALVVDQNTVYFSVETATPSTSCYLLKGSLRDTAVVLDPDFLMPLPKPVAANGAHIYNAGFEALAISNNRILAFFEYNYFPGANSVYEFDSQALSGKTALSQVPIAKVPFRITDITPTGKNHFTAVNYFFKGGGADSIYRAPAREAANASLIKTKAGYQNYCRLIDLELRDDGFSWQPLWEFPAQYMGYNWEGLTAYKQGYFVMNDKYTPQRPYQTKLLYLQKTGGQ